MTEHREEQAATTVWGKPVEAVLASLDVTTNKGLSATAVKKRRQQFGRNRLRQVERTSIWAIVSEQFRSLIVLMLVVAAGISFIFSEWVDGIAIVSVILINAAIGFVTEFRAVRSMETLQKMGDIQANVRRDGQVQIVDAADLVPGDIVIVEGGDVITADLRLITASKLQADESALTGESVPVEKQGDVLPEDTVLAERSNMLFKGTGVTRGAGEGVVVATGMNTELGHISALVEEAEAEFTPLEKRLDQLGRKLIWVTLGIIAIVAIAGILRGREVVLMIETAVALAVAAIPEGLPIVATIALARGMMRMARRQALVSRLAAVETLGSTNVICTDKTGTLTENQMTVTKLVLSGNTFHVSGEGLQVTGEFRQNGTAVSAAETTLLSQALRVGVLCNNATLNGDAIGDPVEVALLVAGAKAELRRDDLLTELPEAREVAFDPHEKMMATFHEDRGRYQVAVKGAPEPVLAASKQMMTDEGSRSLSEAESQTWLKHNEAMAGDGLRVLALATKTTEDLDADPYSGLTFIGLAGLLDPPREDVQPAIQACQEAGIQVTMVTGDQAVTARNVGTAVGLLTTDDDLSVIHGHELGNLETRSAEEQQDLLDASILARVTPEQKLSLIDAYQQGGAIVAMTGDGVNDAPALKKADIGIAMGQRGSQVAQEAADMVLQDDAFATIVAAIEQGRIIFNNIRKFVLYLISCNVSEVMVVFLASLVNMPLPVRPLQILFLNLVTDVFPALALGVGRGDPTIMKQPPREPDEPILTRSHWSAIGGYGFLITMATMCALVLALTWLNMTEEAAVTVSFLTLAFAQLWHVFNMRDDDTGILNNDVIRNPFVWGALVLCTGLLLAAVYLPLLSDVLRTVDPGPAGWSVVIVMSIVPLIIGQVWKALAQTRHK
jgi:Ca2+-transporting ATPase